MTDGPAGETKTAGGKAKADAAVIAAYIRSLAGEGARIAFVSGKFNIIHPGHLRLFRFAADNADFLVVGALPAGATGVRVTVPTTSPNALPPGTGTLPTSCGAPTAPVTTAPVTTAPTSAHAANGMATDATTSRKIVQTGGLR